MDNQNEKIIQSFINLMIDEYDKIIDDSIKRDNQAARQFIIEDITKRCFGPSRCGVHIDLKERR